MNNDPPRASLRHSSHGIVSARSASKVDVDAQVDVVADCSASTGPASAAVERREK